LLRLRLAKTVYDFVYDSLSGVAGRWGPFMSWLVQPRLVNGPFDDPGLYLDFRFGRRAILFDLGDLAPLSSRELIRVSHVFVSHTHMDHVAGFDRLLRVCLHRPEPLTLVGPPAFTDQVEHRIRSFTWNLLGEHSIDFRLDVMEFDGERLDRTAAFRARESFTRRAAVPPRHPSGTVLAEENMRIEAIALDHGIPSLAFALREELRVNVWRGELEELGLTVGPWLNAAKRAARRGEPDSRSIEIGGDRRVSLGELRKRVFRIGPGQVVAYVTDAASHAENRRKIIRLADKADQLFIEAMFLERDRALATATHHLTARDAGDLARAARVKHLTAFHHSARYLSDPEAIGREVRESFEAAA
jgi:ribonuclease Z